MTDYDFERLNSTLNSSKALLRPVVRTELTAEILDRWQVLDAPYTTLNSAVTFLDSLNATRDQNAMTTHLENSV